MTVLVHLIGNVCEMLISIKNEIQQNMIMRLVS